MSANNIVYVKNYKAKYEVYYQGCADNEDLGSLEKTFKTLKGACKYAQELCEEYNVEYGIRLIF